MLDALGLVGFSLKLCPESQTGSGKLAGDVVGAPATEVETDRVAERLLDVQWLVAHLEGEQEVTARSQYPVELGEHRRELLGREVDDRVSGQESAEAGVGQVEVQAASRPQEARHVRAAQLLDGEPVYSAVPGADGVGGDGEAPGLSGLVLEVPAAHGAFTGVEHVTARRVHTLALVCMAINLWSRSPRPWRRIMYRCTSDPAMPTPDRSYPTFSASLAPGLAHRRPTRSL